MLTQSGLMAQPIMYGFVLNFGLLLAIGPQSAFVLSHGIMRRHILPITMTCMVCDAVLIGMGVLGIGGALIAAPALHRATALFGAAFLFLYGLMSVRSAFGGPLVADRSSPNSGALRAIAATLGVTLLNPWVYLDTLLLMGGAAAQFSEEERPLFLIGALSASGAWFWALGYGGGLLGPLFHYRAVWIALNLTVTAILWSVAATLIREA